MAARELSSLRNAPVLVTGATGFLGSHLVSALAHAGADVHAVSRRRSPTTRVPCARVRWHTADICAADAIRRTVDRVSPAVVFHLAAFGTDATQSDPEEMVRTNVWGSWQLWRAVVDRPCRLVHVGTCGEYGVTGRIREDRACHPRNPYAATKHAAVVLLRAMASGGSRAELVVLRPFGAYGPGDSAVRVIPYVLRGLLRREPITLTAGAQRRDFLYVDDLVRALARAAVRPLSRAGAIYNVGSGVMLRLRDVVDIIAGEVGVPAERYVTFGSRAYRAGEARSFCADTTAAAHDLGFAPRISFPQGIARTVAWYRRAPS